MIVRTLPSVLEFVRTLPTRVISGAALAVVFLAGGALARAVPPEVESLRLPDRQTLAWDPVTVAVGYHVYRGQVADLASSAGECSQGSVTGTEVTVPDRPVAGRAFTYLVAAMDESGEGSVGSDSSGAPREVAGPCVPNGRIFAPQPNGTDFDGVESGFLAARNGKVVVRGWDPSAKKTQAGVIAATGEFITHHTDLEIVGRGLNWHLSRTYRSQVAWNGPLGHGWFFSDAEHLRAGTGGNVDHCTGDGRCETFTRGATGFASPEGQFAVLRSKSDGSYALRDPDGLLRTFNPLDGSSVAGALVTREDAHGSTIRYLYDHQGLLTTVVDTLGRAIDYGYDADGRVIRVSDPTGREVVFAYDADGNLSSVRSPVVTGTPHGNDFPSGKTVTYSYSSGASDARLNHNLLTITDPRGQVWLTNTYSSQPDDEATGALSFDRVLQQDVGGTGAAGVPAGGTVSFSYQALNPGADPGLLDLERRQTLVTDPEGHTFEHRLNARGHELTHVVQQATGDLSTELRYNADGLLAQADLPGGASVRLTYDETGADRYRQGNLLEVRRVADPVRGDGRGGPQSDLVTTYTYEPLYNQLRTMVDPRGNEAGYTPPNGGEWSAARYTTTWSYDYQEGDPDLNGVNAYAAEWGIDLTTAELNLGDLNGDGRVDQSAGARVRRDDPTVRLDPASRQAGVEGDNQQEVVTLWRHNDFGQLIGVVDPAGVESTFSYHPESDPDGDGASTPPPADGRSLDGSTGGYLAERRDGTLSVLRLSYDRLGHPTDLIDARGVRHVRVYNALDQLVEQRTAAATADKSGPDGDKATGVGESGLSPLSYKTRYEYDANDNLSRLLREDRGDTRSVGGWAESSWTYDVLDRPLSYGVEVSGTLTVRGSFRYDGDGNVVRVIAPEGNEVQGVYDARGLLTERTVGAAGPFGGTPATWAYTYDDDGALLRVDDPVGSVVDFAYDGLGRRVRRTDGVGGVTDYFHDPIDNLVQVQVRGTVGGASPTDRSGSRNTLLRDVRYLHDELGRVVRVDRVLGMPAGSTPQRPASLTEGGLLPGDGLVNTIFEYDAAGRRTFLRDDHGATTAWSWNGQGRLSRVELPEGSTVELTWDDGGNLAEAETVDLHSAGGPSSSLLTTFFYDAVGRLTLRVDNAGNAWRWGYDSFFDVIYSSDPLGPPGGTVQRRSPAHAGESVAVNAHGNITEVTYDGMSRRLSTRRILTASGQGDGTTSPVPDASNPYNSSGEIVTSWTWDDNSRLTTLTNPRGNVVSYGYDNLDRVVTETWPGETTVSRAYDPAGRLTRLTDRTGSVFDYAYDAEHRLTRVDIAPAPRIEGTTQQLFEYNGMGQVSRAFDNNNALDPDDDGDSLRYYDLLGRLVEEEQRLPFSTAFRAVDLAYVADGQVSSVTYPSGRSIDYSYDAAGRLTTVSDGGSSGGTVSLRYLGMDRVASVSSGSGIETSVSFDATGRVAEVRHNSGGSLIAGFRYGYDGAGRVTSELRIHDATVDLTRGVRLSRDSAGRVVSAVEALFDAALTPSGTPDDDLSWTLDAVGNAPELVRNARSYGATPNNLERYDELQCCGKASDDRVPDDFHDDLSTPDADGRNFAHDENGRQTITGEVEIRYDAFGRPVRLLRVSDSSVVARYRYDGRNRQIHRVLKGSGGTADEHHLLYYLDQQPLEERDDTDRLLRQVGVTPSTGLLWQIRDFAAGSPAEHMLPNASGSVTALASASGSVLERVSYGTQGVPLFRGADNSIKVDAVGVPIVRSDFQLTELLGARAYLHELGTRAATRNDDWGGAYLRAGALYDPNQGRALSNDERCDDDKDGYCDSGRRAPAGAVGEGGLQDGVEDSGRGRRGGAPGLGWWAFPRDRLSHIADLIDPRGLLAFESTALRAPMVVGGVGNPLERGLDPDDDGDVVTEEDLFAGPDASSTVSDGLGAVLAGTISKADAKRALDYIIAKPGSWPPVRRGPDRPASTATKKGNAVALVGLGSFSAAKRAARTGRNPQTGKEIQIAARRAGGDPGSAAPGTDLEATLRTFYVRGRDAAGNIGALQAIVDPVMHKRPGHPHRSAYQGDGGPYTRKRPGRVTYGFDGAGGPATTRRKHPGRVKYSNVTLERSSGAAPPPPGDGKGSSSGKSVVKFKAGADLSKKVN